MSKDQPQQQEEPFTSETMTPALLAHAQKALDACHPNLARKFLLRAYSVSPQNPHVLLQLGVVEMERMNAAGEDDDPEDVADEEERDLDTETRVHNCAIRAREYFLEAVRLWGEAGWVVDEIYEAHLYLGQLSAGKVALEYYDSAANLLSVALQKAGVDTMKATPAVSTSAATSLLLRKLSNALCSMAEIYMTDCCDFEEAESKCQSYAQRATEIDPQNPEAHQTLASVRMSQCRPDDARKSLETSMDIWINSIPQPILASEQQQQASSSSSPSHPTPPAIPPYPARINLTKLLLELSMHDRALAVLKTIEEENDEDLELWYLYGYCLYRMGGGRGAVPQDGDYDNDDLDSDVAGPAVEVADDRKKELWNEAAECFEHFMQLYERLAEMRKEAMAADGEGMDDGDGEGNENEEEMYTHAVHLLRSEIEPFLGGEEEGGMDVDGGEDAMDV
ncbi:uncharacterized protein EV422DRAFT_548602 [Fimicolochytrium jonesii]|uniref:uncharacterized protein n=1 Tax=Fimicolochytrium jonesii TaxID=1396493 RepID=UPI0022FEF7AF|nr:uncharacterized protein EV422DRAFT_548602 [Fimicolochytrium jonesii]KAI8815659.1 hypothetical protein EV422DRAFT_548602 [Fimicolochytrium jonesii]